MKTSIVKEIVEREIEPLKEKLGIKFWKIKVSYNLRSNSGFSADVGHCTRLVDYDQAYIQLDPSGLKNEEHVIEILLHELFHIVLSPLDILCNSLHELFKDDEKLKGVMESIRVHSIEKAVINLERMYHNLEVKDES